MPELPEVETIRLGLEKYLVGRRIEVVEVRLKKLVTGDTKHVTGAKVVAVRRFGKGLVIDLDNEYSIAIHVKLTGQLIYRGPGVPEHVDLSKEKVGSIPNKWTHVVFRLDNEGTLYYNDLRQFGWIKIVRTDKVSKLPFFEEMGPEPLPSSGQAALTLGTFSSILRTSNAPVKSVLMDQKRIGGVGNIYANDALFDARIDPRRKSKSVSEKEAERLYQSIIKVLKRGLEYGGASELAYVNALGEEGHYQEHFLVYGREGQQCRVCRSTIQKIKLSGRGTYFCPMCQK